MVGIEQGEYRTREEQKASGYKPEERVSVIHQEDGHSYHYKVVDSADSMKKVGFVDLLTFCMPLSFMISAYSLEMAMAGC